MNCKLSNLCANHGKSSGYFRKVIVSLLFGGLSTASAQLIEAPGHTKLAATGEVTPDNHTFTFLAPPWSVSASGEAVFTGDYAVQGVSGTIRGAWGASSESARRTIVAKGLAAPGGGTYQGVISSAKDSIFTSAGYGAFLAAYRAPFTSVDSTGLFLATPSNATFNLATDGQAADGGGVYKAMQLQAQWSVSTNGKVGFYSATTGGPGGGYYYGKLVGVTPVVQKVALHGEVAPGADGTFVLANLSHFGVRAAVNDSGWVFFRSNTTLGTNDTVYQWDGTTTVKIPGSEHTDSFMVNNAGQIALVNNLAGIVRFGTSASTQIIAQPGAPAPGGTLGSSVWGKPALNEAGQVVFVSGGGIYLWDTGVLTLIALSGQPAPGHGTFGNLSTVEPLLTNTGLVIFSAPTSDGTRIMMGNGTEIANVVAELDPLSGEFVDEMEIATSSDSPPYVAGQGPVNDAGQIAYWATLKPSSSSGVDKQAVFLFTPPSRWWAGGSGTWDLGAHWQFGFLPNLARNVIIDPVSTATVTGPSSNTTVRSLKVGGGGGAARLELPLGVVVGTSAGATVESDGVLAGRGTLSGSLTVSGTQELRSDTPTQTLTTATYKSGSHLAVSLLTNADSFGPIIVSNASIAAGAVLDVNLSSPGSTVDFTDSFWQQKHKWTIIRASTNAPLTVSGVFTLGAGAIPATLLDSVGHTATAYGAFTVARNPTTPVSIELSWGPVQTTPAFSAQPISRVVSVGSAVSFSATGTGNALSYQWIKNAINIPGANGTSYAIPAPTFASAGNYQVKITNDIGSLNSLTASLGVINGSGGTAALVEGQTLSLTVLGSAPPGKVFTCQWRRNGIPIIDGPSGPSQMISGATTTRLTITKTITGNAGNYTCDLSLPSSTVLPSGTYAVSITPETVPPSTPTISAPGAGAILPVNMGGTITVTGNAADNKGVALVRVKLNAGAFVNALLAQPGNPATAYSLAVTPVAGVNTLAVQAVDMNGTPSTILTRSFTVTRPLSVNVAGSGSVTAGFAPASFRETGKRYTISATPGLTPSPGFVFNGWTVGGGPSLSDIGVTAGDLELRVLNFTFRENLILTANFIPNPFTPAITGRYNGLITPSPTLPTPTGTATSNDTVGFFSAAVTSIGTFSGTLKIDGLTLPVAGVFTNLGVARFGVARSLTLSLSRSPKPALLLSLNLDMSATTSKITGSLVQPLRITEKVSIVDADRAAYGPLSHAPEALAGTISKAYTLVFKHRSSLGPSFPSTDYPQGDGFATCTLRASDGLVSAVGKLADNTAIAASAPLSRNNTWPLFAQLYSARGGCFTSIVQVDDAPPNTDMTSLSAAWLRPFQLGQWYPYGWEEGIPVDIIGSKYAAPPSSVFPGLLPVNITTGNVDLILSNGQLLTPITKHINISPANLVTKAPLVDTTFTIALTPSSGVFSGAFSHPGGGSPAFNGVLFQKGSNKAGYGYFLTVLPPVLTGEGESGTVKLQAQ